MPISPGLPWPCAPLNWHNSAREGRRGRKTHVTFVRLLTRVIFVSRAFIIPLQGQPWSRPKGSQPLGTKLAYVFIAARLRVPARLRKGSANKVSSFLGSLTSRPAVLPHLIPRLLRTSHYFYLLAKVWGGGGGFKFKLNTVKYSWFPPFQMLVRWSDPHFITLANLHDSPPPPPKFGHLYSPLPRA